ncbi:MAG TPA: [NiFe]-hydrogenase assembly chaperone HybE [Methyloversatilis sp.]
MSRAALATRVAALEALFRDIADTRMSGVPVLNGALRVEAVGFAPHAPEPGTDDCAIGILITPWFMNLLRLPLVRENDVTRVGRSRSLAVGRERFDFIGAHETAFGSFEACSLFSPMFDFPDQAAARLTAVAVLSSLHVVPPEHAERPVQPARRGFLFGRSGTR